MGGGPSRSHIQNQHTQGITIINTLAWIASMHKLYFTCPGLAALRTWVDSPNNLLELIYHNITHQFILQIDVQHINTYPFNHREHMYSWVSIIWVQICINHIRIDVSCCIIIMIPWERPGNIILIVGALCNSLLALGSWYRSDPFQKLDRQLNTSNDNQ